MDVGRTADRYFLDVSAAAETQREIKKAYARIYLRACVVSYSEIEGVEPVSFAAVMLPDGRILFGEDGGKTLEIHSSEDELRKKHAGARVDMFPDADGALNS